MLQKKIKEADIKALKALLAQSDRIVLTAHVRPDGDAIGSTLGMWHLLCTLGKRASVVMPDLAPRSLAFLPGFKDIVTYSKYPDFAAREINEADLILCCDFNKPSRQDQLEPLIQGATCKKVLIDHHQHPDNFCDLTFSFPEMSSTCELMFRIIAALGYYDKMNLDSATCLCTGLITDTRNLSVNCSQPDIYIVLMKLLEKGVDKQKIVKETLMTKSLDSVKLRAYAISRKLDIFHEHKAAIICLDKSELDKFHYERGDTEGLVNDPLEIRGIVSSFFLREDPDCIKVSARSVDNFPVSKVCEDLFGGGGHIMASGGEFHGTMEECKNLLIKNFHNYDQYLKK